MRSSRLEPKLDASGRLWERCNAWGPFVKDGLDGIFHPRCDRPFGHTGQHVTYYKGTAARLAEWEG